MKHRNFIQRASLVWFILMGLPACGPLATPSPTPTSASSATPEPTSTAIPAPAATQTPISPGAVLFWEDFEDNTADGFNYAGVNWKIIAEENGNKVYEVDTTTDTAGPSIGFGSTNWTDYAVEYRVKALNSNADIWTNFRNSEQGYYVQRLSLKYDTVDLYISLLGDEWQPLAEPGYNTIKKKWYLVRIEAQGETIRLFINDILTMQITDSRLTAGDVAIGNLGDTHAQYDDIHVIALEGPTAPTP